MVQDSGVRSGMQVQDSEFRAGLWFRIQGKVWDPCSGFTYPLSHPTRHSSTAHTSRTCGRSQSSRPTSRSGRRSTRSTSRRPCRFCPPHVFLLLVVIELRLSIIRGGRIASFYYLGYTSWYGAAHSGREESTHCALGGGARGRPREDHAGIPLHGYLAQKKQPPPP